MRERKKKIHVAMVFTVEEGKETEMGQAEEKLYWTRVEVSVTLYILIFLYIFSSSRKV